jgi:hypothetical protein
MRKFVVALAVLLGGLAAVVAPAGASAANPVKNVKQNQVSGPFTGTSTVVSGFPASCPSYPASEVFDGTYTAPQVHRTGSFHLDGCDFLDGADLQFSYLGFIGTATVTTPAGTVLTGSATGLISVSTTGGSDTVDLTLSLSGRPGGSFTVHLTGTIQTPVSSDGVPTPISGTLTST